MKIVLAAINAKYIHSNLAVQDLCAYAKKYGETVTVREYTINQLTDEILKDLYCQKADLLAFSCYLWNISYVRQVARELHKLQPGLPIWVGGPEVSYQSRAFLRENTWAAGVMRGEGEVTFLELIRSYKGERELLKVKGLTVRLPDGGFWESEERPAMDLSDIPFPYGDLSDYEHRIIYYESSRGCPFSCSYCLSSIDKCLRFRSLDLVLPELQFFLDQKVPQVKFVDRTFNCRPSHAKAIWKYLIEHDNGITNFHFEIAADLLDEAELELLAGMRPGLIQLEIGVQSTNSVTIREIRRVMDFKKVGDIVRRIRSVRNIHQHLDLIAGLPYEDLESFKKSFNDVYELLPDQFQLGFLKLLKGSYMQEKAEEYGCVCQSRPPYEVLYTKWLSYSDVLRLKRVEEMVEVYYNSAQFVHTLPECLKLFSDPFSFYDILGQFYEEKGYLAVSHARIRRYEILLEFLETVPGGKERLQEFQEWMLLDLYERENLKTRPRWAKDLSPYKQMFRAFYGAEAREHVRLPEYKSCDARQLAGMTHLEVFTCIFKEETAVLFSYKERDPLSRSAKWQLLPKEELRIKE